MQHTILSQFRNMCFRLLRNIFFHVIQNPKICVSIFQSTLFLFVPTIHTWATFVSTYLTCFYILYLTCFYISYLFLHILLVSTYLTSFSRKERCRSAWTPPFHPTRISRCLLPAVVSKTWLMERWVPPNSSQNFLVPPSSINNFS